MANSLIGKTILVTRPEGQNKHLCELLLTQAAKVIALPTLEIYPIQNHQYYSKINAFDFVIFTSANAVTFSANQIHQYYKNWPQNVQVAAIGNRTRKVLQSNNLPCHITPAAHFSSEALLSMDNFKDLTGKKILIITGTNGRQLLKQTLEARGACVEEQFCYERRVPNYSASAIIKLSEMNIDFLVCTSNSSLENLAVILGAELTAKFKSTQIVGFSKRIIPLATRLGFKKIPIMTAEASDESILAAIMS